MEDYTETRRLPRARASAIDLPASELEELRDLYAELAPTVESAAELLGANGPMPTGMRYERFMEATERMASLLVEIDGLLSR